MKQFNHKWTDDFFLMHIQLNNVGKAEVDVQVKRHYEGGKYSEEVIQVKKDMKSHRFMISRSHPREDSVTVFYTDKLELEAYKVDDRAFYPANAFFKG